MCLIDLAQLVASLDADELLLSIYRNKKTQAFIIGLNTREQLFIDREDSRGIKLKDIGGGYSPVTEELSEGIQFTYQGEVNVKLAGESPFLYDTGDFFKSFKITPIKGGFLIDANTQKDDTDLIQEWGPDILGLTNESTEQLVTFLEIALAEELQKRFDLLQ